MGQTCLSTGTQCLVDCRLCWGLLCTDCAKVHLTFIEEGIYSLIRFLPDNSMKRTCGFYCHYSTKTLPFSVMSTNDFWQRPLHVMHKASVVY